jgi:lipoprotein-anchoring transpeptidase ErfK/SrfK
MPRVLSLLMFVTGLTLRPYVPPVLDPEPAFNPTAVSSVEVLPENGDWDANVYARPNYKAPLVGNVARGARVRVRGELRLPRAPYCSTQMYYALEPFGWLCSADTKVSSLPATTESVLELVPGTPLPYRYAMVTVEEGTFLPMWGSVEALWQHADPERQLSRGDTIALGPTMEQFEGNSYYITVDNKVVPVRGTISVKNYSEWQGEVLSSATHLPFGWVTPNKAPVYDAPKGKKVEDLPRRTRVDVLEEITEGTQRWLRIGEGRFVKADLINEVRKRDRPLETGQHPQWVDVDLGEQVVVAYQNDQPVYATLTSSGREPNHTPRGNYPVWGKASAITMKSQEYDDTPYYVNRVPWVMFFQAHNALHGAYWHDRFGVVKSHGCANLAPKDARWLFDWLEPKLPPGWTAVRYWNLTQAPVVHVRNSRKANKPIYQERNIGPPDKDDEAERLDAALARREAKEREEAAALSAQSGTGVTAQGGAGMMAPAPLFPAAMPAPMRAPEMPPAPLR